MGTNVKVLADRENEDYFVTLLWDKQKNEVVLCLFERTTEVELYQVVPNGLALDAFYHPNCYIK